MVDMKKLYLYFGIHSHKYNKTTLIESGFVKRLELARVA